MNSDVNSESASEINSGGTSCYGCAHFAITWEKNFPYACKKMEFRSKRLPCEEVLEADGQPCLARTERVDASTKKPIRFETINSSGGSSGAHSTKRASRIGGKLNLSV